MFGLCLPATVYLILAFIGIIGSLSMNHAMSIVLNVLFSAAWVYILNALCAAGYSAVSWFLVLLPVILFVIFLLFAGSLFVSAARRGQGLQYPQGQQQPVHAGYMPPQQYH